MPSDKPREVRDPTIFDSFTVQLANDARERGYPNLHDGPNPFRSYGANGPPLAQLTWEQARHDSEFRRWLNNETRQTDIEVARVLGDSAKADIGQTGHSRKGKQDAIHRQQPASMDRQSNTLMGWFDLRRLDIDGMSKAVLRVFETPSTPVYAFEGEKSSFEETKSLLSSIDSTSTVSTIPAGPKVQLVDLPDKDVLEVMTRLPPSSLYSLRQTSRRFMDLFWHERFEKFHHDAAAFTGFLRFSFHGVNPSEIAATASALSRDKRCALCQEAEAAGIADARRREIERLWHCSGCKEDHEAVFFLSKDVRRHQESLSPLICIGRLAGGRVCDHRSSKLSTWSDLERFAHLAAIQRRSNKDEIFYRVACTDLGHEPGKRPLSQPEDLGASFPRLVVSNHPDLPSRFHLAFGWEQPVLFYGNLGVLKLSQLREAVSQVVIRAFQYHEQRTCDHFFVHQILGFVKQGICECFTHQRAWMPLDIHEDHYSSPPDCRCGRLRRLECHICGAMFRWLLHKGQLVLSFRYTWEVQKPTSWGWLCFLYGKANQRHELFSDDRKHVLWCDSKGCHLTRARGWEAWVKASILRDYERQSPEDRQGHDFEMMQEISYQGSFREW